MVLLCCSDAETLICLEKNKKSSRVDFCLSAKLSMDVFRLLAGNRKRKIPASLWHL